MSKTMKKRLVIIGSGPAGLSCALSALKNGIPKENILVLEREEELGGTLNLCIHAGFGKDNKTGTELATELADKVRNAGITCMTSTTVLSIDKRKIITLISPELGYTKITAEAIVLATGCRERSRGGLSIGGTRPAGILSAGTAQRFINLEGYMPGAKTVVVGTTDLALVIARRITLEGGQVVFVCDSKKKPQSERVKVGECLDYFNIPLKLHTTITRIFGKDRIEGVEIAELDKKGRPIKETKERVECDSLVYSCGFIPENELANSLGIEMRQSTHGPRTTRKMETSIDGIFSCGNSRMIHEDVDDIILDGKKAGKFVAEHLKSLKEDKKKKKEKKQ